MTAEIQAPTTRIWQRHLLDEMTKAGHTVDVRRTRMGNVVWSIDGGRWIPTGPASRKMEIVIYGRPNP